MKHEYDEGPEAIQRFEQGMSRLFKVPEESVKGQAYPKVEGKRTQNT